MRIFRLRILVLAAIAVLVIVLVTRQAARILVVDRPEQSDAIVVLAGEIYVRPARAIDLLRQGVAGKAFLDVEATALVYDQGLPDIAQRYINDLGEASRVKVCPIVSFSTFAEADDVNRCLSSIGAHRVLIVTSDYHTRRALMIFRHRLPQYEFSVAAARDPDRFGEAWWTTREWAKNTFGEWSKIFWFEAVDRWR
jgi:uncharacterized SAM-binding protein YcdF (DUF218 family)